MVCSGGGKVSAPGAEEGKAMGSVGCRRRLSGGNRCQRQPCFVDKFYMCQLNVIYLMWHVCVCVSIHLWPAALTSRHAAPNCHTCVVIDIALTSDTEPRSALGHNFLLWFGCHSTMRVARHNNEWISKCRQCKWRGVRRERRPFRLLCIAKYRYDFN